MVPRTKCAECGYDLAFQHDEEEPVLVLFGCTGPGCMQSIFGVKKFLEMKRRRLGLVGLPEVPAS